MLEREQDRGAADLLMGNVWLSENRLEDAIDCLQRAEQKEEDWPNLQCLIGTVYLRLGRWDDAERTFGKAVKIDSDNVRAHFGMSLAYLAQDRLEEATAPKVWYEELEKRIKKRIRGYKAQITRNPKKAVTQL